MICVTTAIKSFVVVVVLFCVCVTAAGAATGGGYDYTPANQGHHDHHEHVEEHHDHHEHHPEPPKGHWEKKLKWKEDWQKVRSIEHLFDRNVVEVSAWVTA